jgi:hypothetical protein
MSRAGRFLRIPWSEKKAFGISLLAMTATRIALWFFTPRQVARSLDRLSIMFLQAATESPIELRRLIRRIMQARHYAPVPTTCLSESLAAKAVLSRYGHRGELRIGVHKGAGRFEAHAWLECADHILIGTPSPDGKTYVNLAGAERLAG